MGSFQYIGGVFGLDGVEDAGEETLLLGSWSSAYIKLGAQSDWDCFNIDFRLKSDLYLCVQVPWIQLLVLL